MAKSYVGKETIKALENFPFKTPPVRREYVLALTTIKKAAAVANWKAGNFGSDVKDAIVKACDDVLSGKLKNNFNLSFLQGGAGTSIHMNTNEVIANRATELYKGKKKIEIHPNDHVNRSMSTNDVTSSSLRIAVYKEMSALLSSVENFSKSLERKGNEFKNIVKLGRTHMQDAVPTTLGAEFKAYAFSVERHLPRIKLATCSLLELSLGGTALGNSVNASPTYIKEVYRELKKLTGSNFRPAKNLMTLTSSHVDFLPVSQSITALSTDLSKIANDLKLMSSGPRGGWGEIELPELQKGSSIMPGKVNPVIPELINQIYFLVSGNNLTIEQAVEGSQMEFGVMLPIVIERLLESIHATAAGLNVFAEKCISGIKANKKKCLEHLENSFAYATCLTPILGYDKVTVLVKKALAENKTLTEIVLGEKAMSEKDFKKAIQEARL